MFELTTTTMILASTAGTALLGYFVYFTIDLYFNRLKFKHIPGPPPYKGILGFYTGNLMHIIEADKKGIVLPDLLNEWYFKKVFKFKIFYFGVLNV